MGFIKEKINSEKIQNLVCIKLDAYEDHRGEIWTLYSEELYDLNFVADKLSISKFGVLRGFHGDSHTSKLITCIHGQMQLVVADLRKNSETYGEVETFIISDLEPVMVLVPAGCINAHLSLSDKCVFYYKWSEKYQGPEEQVTIAWNDPDLGVDWKITNPILSERDENGIFYKGTYL